MANRSVRDVQDWLKATPLGVRRGVEKTVKDQADRLAEAMRAQVPVITGKARGTIKVQLTRDSLKFYVVAGGDETRKEVRGGSGVFTYDYVRALEFGTVNAPAVPFFYATARGLKSSMHRAIETAVSRQVAIRRTVLK